MLRRPDGATWELGRGAMGVTYKAFDERLRIEVALKLITPGQVDDAKTQALFLREARAAARVRHPNVASVVYLNDTPSDFFYAMEFIEGKSLQEWLRTRGALPAALAIGLAMQIARGLGAIHHQHIVHRDLKPANLMIVAAEGEKTRAGADANPDAWQVKIIDFGLARGFAGEGLGTEINAQTIGFRGTALYASPEQCEERGGIDGRSDLYSLGCILWEMLLGAPPFRARTHRELLNKHVAQSAPLERIAHLPDGLQAVLSRLLEKDPAHRFDDADAVEKALELCRERLASGEEKMEDVDRTVPHVAPVIDPAPNVAAAPAMPTAPRAGRAIALSLAAAAMLIVMAVWFFPRNKLTLSPPAAAPTAPSIAPAAPRKSIAILPFENRSAEKENDYLTDGIHEDILTNLARIQDLKVVSRGAVMAYKPGANRNLREIARELGVGSVLEGSVRRSGNRIRVTTQLVDTSNSQSVWAETYDRELTDVLEIQTQISQEIAKALAANLSPAEIQQMAKPPTNNPEAYDEYLRGRDIAARLGDLQAGHDEAIRLYERAVGLDPNFALAYAELGQMHAYSFQSSWDPSDARAERARSAIETARRLQPELPQVVAAHANYLFRVERNHDEALRILRAAERKTPDDEVLLITIGNLLRRRDRWDEALEYCRRAEGLAPKDTAPLDLQCYVLDWMRRFEELERVLQRALILAPDPGYDEGLALVRAQQKNDWASYIRELRRLDPAMNLERRAEYRFVRRDYAGALEALQAVAGDKVGRKHKAILIAENQIKLGNRAAADASYRDVELALRRKVTEWPRDHIARMDLAEVCAVLGKREEAMQRADEALQAVPESTDVVEGRNLAGQAAIVYGRLGDFDRACKIYRHLLEVPSYLTRFDLRNNPIYDDFRKNPQFAALIAEPGP